jgi:hypothetical protein
MHISLSYAECTYICLHALHWWLSSCSCLNHFMVLLSQAPVFSGFPAFPNGDFQMVPVMYPGLVPGSNTLQNQEQMNRGAGIYAVPSYPYMGPVPVFPSNALIPLTYNIPT